MITSSNDAGRITLLAGALMLLLSGLPGAAEQQVAAVDTAREQRMRAEIIDAILEGEPIDLETIDGQVFLGIYTESQSAPVKGTVLVMHGRGFHPDWHNVVQPLRVGLTAYGWNTLSIQLPVLGKAAKYFDYFTIFDAAIPRIEAAIAKARELSAGPVVLVAHSCASHMTQHWIHVRGPAALAQFDGFAGIGMGATDYGQPMREPFALGKIRVPVLDLYAADDYPAVHRLAPVRFAAMQQAGNPKNAQIVVPDAGHYFVDRGEPLVEAVAAWLDTL